jgi:hypothetical protein
VLSIYKDSTDDKCQNNFAMAAQLINIGIVILNSNDTSNALESDISKY